MQILKKTVAIIPLITLITSCSTDIYKNANKNYNEDKSIAEKHLSSSTNESIARDTSVVRILDKLYIGSRSTARRPGGGKRCFIVLWYSTKTRKHY